MHRANMSGPHCAPLAPPRGKRFSSSVSATPALLIERVATALQLGDHIPAPVTAGICPSANECRIMLLLD
jgi:hypothetical protein